MTTTTPNATTSGASPAGSGKGRGKRKPRTLGHKIAIALWFIVVLWLCLPIAVSLVSNIFFGDGPTDAYGKQDNAPSRSAAPSPAPAARPDAPKAPTP